MDSFPRRFRANLARLATRASFRLPADEIPPGFRNSAVLVAFWPEDRDVCVVLTRRSPKLAQHAGQTAFPGGRLDADETFPEAALREAQEEIGLDPRAVEIVGPLDDAWSGAGHVVVPVVGWLEQAPALRPNPAEVAEILVARVSDLLRPASRGTIEVVHRGVHYRNPTLSWPGGDVNGLSADLLLEAIGWGMGERPDPGPLRLAHLRTYFGGA